MYLQLHNKTSCDSLHHRNVEPCQIFIFWLGQKDLVSHLWKSSEKEHDLKFRMENLQVERTTWKRIWFQYIPCFSDSHVLSEPFLKKKKTERLRWCYTFCDAAHNLITFKLHFHLCSLLDVSSFVILNQYGCKHVCCWITIA